MELRSPSALLRQGMQAAMEEQSPAEELLADTLLRQLTQDDVTYSSCTSGVDATMEEQSPAEELPVDPPCRQGKQDAVRLDAAGGVGGNGDSSSAIDQEVNRWFRCAVSSRLCHAPKFQLDCGHLACGDCRAGHCRECGHDIFFAGGPCRNAVVEDHISVSARSSMVDCSSDGNDDKTFDCETDPVSASPLSNLDTPDLSMMDCSSDGNDGEKFDFEIDVEPLPASALANLDSPDLSMLDVDVLAHGEPPSSSLVVQYVGKGFPKEMVLKAIDEIGNKHANELHDLLLKYKERGDHTLVGNFSTSGCTTDNVEDANLAFVNRDKDDDHAGDTEVNFYGSIDELSTEKSYRLETKALASSLAFPEPKQLIDGAGEACQEVLPAAFPLTAQPDFKQEKLEKDKIKFLIDQGFSKDEANMIITRIGSASSFMKVASSSFVLVGSFETSVLVDSNHEGPKFFFGVLKKARFEEERKKKRKYYGGREQGNQAPMVGSHYEPMTPPNRMVGFSMPGDVVSYDRKLPKLANGPPFFYYENVAKAPKGVWRTISETLYDVKPEFVDSKYFCATARKRGYIHNLPIKNRNPLLPVPPMIICKAFPRYMKWSPPWDKRRKFNCLSTCVPSTKLSEDIEFLLGRANNTPSRSVQKVIIDACKEFNLVWVGKNKVGSLEAREMESLLGFTEDHTRVVGIKKRYKSLGNSFQVNTVAYHLSVLKDLFPDGMKVLSLFSGIGGAEVALHSLGIRLRIVVSVEICKVNRRILRGWWNQTQKGCLIEVPDVHNLTDDIVEDLTTEFGGFDLVIGGSPCSNLAGRNRFHRDGLEGEHSALFYQYFRILDAVKSVMARM